jgi:hypothetical protein
MLNNVVSSSAVIIILAASTGLLISRDWRWSLALCAGQYLVAFWLVSLHWPFGLAAVKLVSGWMGIAALGLTRLNLSGEDQTREKFWPRQLWFHFLLAAIIILLALAAAPRLEFFLPGLELPVITGSLVLMGMGVLHLGITSQNLRVILGLLTFLCGFEILYASVEGPSCCRPAGSINWPGLVALFDAGRFPESETIA